MQFNLLHHYLCCTRAYIIYDSFDIIPSAYQGKFTICETPTTVDTSACCHSYTYIWLINHHCPFLSPYGIFYRWSLEHLSYKWRQLPVSQTPFIPVRQNQINQNGRQNRWSDKCEFTNTKLLQWYMWLTVDD
jgi:hypothetical protein